MPDRNNREEGRLTSNSSNSKQVLFQKDFCDVLSESVSNAPGPIRTLHADEGSVCYVHQSAICIFFCEV